MIYSNDWLLAQLANGQTFKYLYFWGHRTRPDGVITSSCLSQWYPRGFTHEGIHYPTAEHWMMAEKARLFNDEETLQKIIAAEKAPVAKKLGREVKNFDVNVWKTKMCAIVAKGSYLKFGQHPDLLEFLTTTGNKILVEASPFDPHWGIGMDKKAAEATIPENWKGTNWLGWCLMEARDTLIVQP